MARYQTEHSLTYALKMQLKLTPTNSFELSVFETRFENIGFQFLAYFTSNQCLKYPLETT